MYIDGFISEHVICTASLIIFQLGNVNNWKFIINKFVYIPTSTPLRSVIDLWSKSEVLNKVALYVPACDVHCTDGCTVQGENKCNSTCETGYIIDNVNNNCQGEDIELSPSYVAGRVQHFRDVQTSRMRTRTYTHTHVHTRTRTRTHARTHARAHTHTHTHTHMQTYSNTYMYIDILWETYDCIRSDRSI